MNLNKNQANKVALITGGARRIGAAIASYLHAQNYEVIIHCRHSTQDAQTLASTCNQIRPESALVVTQDLCASEAASKIIDSVLAWKGRLDLLVNNASIFIKDSPGSLDDERWDLLFATNVKAPYDLSLAARTLLSQTQGCIINITDIHALSPLKGYSIYCQTKAALWMQTQALAKELAPEIRVNAVAPGAIAWPEEENTLTTSIKHKIIEQTPLKKHGDPLFIAQAVLTMAENPFVTGQVLAVDGGRSI